MPTILTIKNRTCSEICHKATGGRCSCVCGGKYHGIARNRFRQPGTVAEAEHLLQHGWIRGESLDMFEGVDDFIRDETTAQRLFKYFKNLIN